MRHELPIRPGDDSDGCNSMQELALFQWLVGYLFVELSEATVLPTTVPPISKVGVDRVLRESNVAWLDCYQLHNMKLFAIILVGPKVLGCWHGWRSLPYHCWTSEPRTI